MRAFWCSLHDPHTRDPSLSAKLLKDVFSRSFSHDNLQCLYEEMDGWQGNHLGLPQMVELYDARLI